MSIHTTRDARAIGADLAALRPFRTHGSLAGAPGHGGPFGSGRLSGADADAYSRDMGAIDYVVTSYATPIAWHTPAGWHRVAQRFSVTTSRQQSTIAGALSGLPMMSREVAESSR